MNRLSYVVSLSLLIACGGEVAAANPVPPNVLFIAVDDLNDYISPLDNHPGISTPNFDRLAKRSVTFSNAHCAAPACHPSRVAVMTGVHPVRSGLYQNLFGAHGPRWRHESPVLEKAVVLSQHFRNNGYHAAGGGKIFHTLQWTPGDSQNDPAAWDTYRGDPLDPISADWPRPASTRVDQNKGFVGRRPLSNHFFGAAVIDQDEETYGDHLVVDWAIDQMHAQQDKPLFLAVGLFRPHIPFEVSQKWFDLYPLESVQLPAHLENDLDDARAPNRQSWHKWVTTNKQWKPLMQGYLASVSYVDHQVGRLLDGLDRSGLKDNTIVVLWTDHGFHIGEKENWEKFCLWEQTTRVPLFIHVPGLSKDGERTRQPTTLTDLYPTLCELTGLPTPAQCTGTSLVKQLKNPQQLDERTSLTSHVMGRTSVASHAVSDTQFRYIRYHDGFEELYDLEKDRNEFTNLAANPAFAKIKQRLALHLPKNAAPSVGIPTESPYHRGRGKGHGRKSSIANKPLNLAFEVTPHSDAPDGVIAAYGGDYNGYALYVQGGVLYFGVRVAKKLHLIHADAPGEAFTVRASLRNDGAMRLQINGKEAATGEATGLIPVEPYEGGSLGSDDRTPVGNYASPFRYSGTVSPLAGE